MAITGTKLALLLGLFVASSVMAAAQTPPEDKKNQGAVMIYNPAMLVVDILVDDKNVRVATERATMEIAHDEQSLQISVAGTGEPVDMTVHDGDMLVVIPDPADNGILQVFKILAEEPRPEVLPVGVPKPDVRPASVPKPDIRP